MREDLRAFSAKLLVEPALNDPESQLSGGRITLEASAGPLMGPLHRGLRDSGRSRPRYRLVEGHGDVGAELALDFHHRLGREMLLAPIEMRSEGRARIADLDQVVEAEYLKPATVGQDRPFPAHEFVQPAKPGDPFATGPKRQVIGVAKQDLGTQSADLIRAERLDGGLRPHRHERGRVDHAVRRCQSPAPSAILLGDQFEAHNIPLPL